MGKNPNANRDKVNHRKGKGGGRDRDDEGAVDVQERIDEAARLGCEVWELDEVKAKLEQENDDSSSDNDKKDEEESKDV